MKQLIIAVISTIFFCSNLYSQSNIDRILTEIEKNNTRLAALQMSAEADKIGSKKGIYLQNPELGFNYLWGNPSTLGNRTDVSIKQTFDFPSAYRYKNQISNIRNDQLDLEYRKQLRSLLLQARLVCYDLVYTNTLRSELSLRLTHAQTIASSYKSKFDIGETNILEYNKAQLNLLNIGKELDVIDIERNILLLELAHYNGGIFIDFTDTIFQPQVIPSDFEEWYLLAEQNNPELNWLKQELEISQQQEKLNRALSLPKIQAGYMSEKVVGSQFHGLTLGLSIPLWENKNTVKYVRANSLAIESISIDSRMHFYSQLKALHVKAIGLQKNVNDYRLNLQAYDNTKLIRKALDKGEVSLIDYILEFSIYYESFNKILELERELNKTIAWLNQYM